MPSERKAATSRATSQSGRSARGAPSRRAAPTAGAEGAPKKQRRVASGISKDGAADSCSICGRKPTADTEVATFGVGRGQ